MTPPHPSLSVFAPVFALGVALGGAPTARADEGQWMPAQIEDLDVGALRRTGFALLPTQLWDEDNRESLLRAVVNLSGCSAAFLSEEGLISTNHHCAYRAIQAASSVDRDYLTQGFLARDRKAELPGKGLTVKVLESIRDVTAEVRAVADAAQGEAARAEAVARKEKELVQACEAQGHRTCQVASFYRGSLFQLFEYIELLDVRLVYAPESAVGNYGGEIDNWMWPRHSGDFTLLRAYVAPDGSPAPFAAENVPYRPRRHLEVSPEGVPEGRFVATVGYPGHTDRYLSSSEVERHLVQVLPTTIDMYGAWIDIQQRLVEQAGAESLEARDARRIKVAGRLRSLMNRHKNARGMIDGIRRMHLLGRRQKEDRALAELAAKRGAPFIDVPTALDAMSAEERASFPRHFLLDTLPRGPDSVAVAIGLVRWARERTKPELERAAGYQDRDQERLWRGIERHLGSFDPVVDQALLGDWLTRVRALEASSPDAALPPEITQFDASAITKTTLMTAERAKTLLDGGDEAALAADADPVLAFARAVVPLIEAQEAEERRVEGRELVVGPRYFELLKEVRRGPVYPDANGTLRFSYATVTGYAPRDGMWALPRSSLAGQVAKHTGEEPFNLPVAIREKAADAPKSYWADPDLGDVPVCFLTSSDTTGGNSGSPVIDGKGRLVRFNFDRVWENIAGDFGYNPAQSRNIVVDVRYLLWLLDDVHDAGPLIDELGLLAYRDLPRRPGKGPSVSDQLPKASCAEATPEAGALPLLVLSIALGFTLRRRRQL